ncbi:hypothetical protein [Peribacillus frigoritolerans]|uniref:hypothetical protein n=1 Tax=Peribacillus frigoritolerans TaxID=450367 RepID=UPI0020799C4D|nr:hypothetical protein [Peribacillus frigoritolerans]USK77694.1 hypothetical protein LIT31_26425 [Peribacillus frigoritolerans]USK77772.1 hypothetical protein LIT31_25945 [Peribacillus frigoritolerans]USK77894.1 hypothetical protein LIT31_26785 [Peribacillus frigoritolerans]
MDERTRGLIKIIGLLLSIMDKRNVLTKDEIASIGEAQKSDNIIKNTIPVLEKIRDK